MADPPAEQPPAPPATQTMYAPDGSAVEVPIAQVVDAYHSGTLGFSGSAPVVIEHGGRLHQVSGDEAAAYLDSPRGVAARVGSSQDYQAQQEAVEYNTLGHQTTAAAAGAARGLSLGYSDPAIVAIGGEGARERLAKDQRYNPGAAIGGELAGMVAPMLLPGVGEAEVAGEGAAAARGGGIVARLGQLAAAPTRFAGAAGEAFGGLARAGVEGLGATEGGALARLAHGAAQGAAEGALYGSGQAVSEATLHDEPLTAEKFLAGAGLGAVLGGVAGGGLSAVGSLGRAALSKGSEAAAGLFERFGTSAEKVATKEGELATDLVEKSPLRQWGDNFAQRKAIQSTGANLKQIEVLDRMGPEVKARVAQQILDDLPALEGKSSLATMSKADLSNAGEKNFDLLGADLGDRLDKLDALKTGIKPDIDAIRTRGFKEILEPLLNTPFAETEARAIKSALEDFGDKAGAPGFRELQQMRARLDKTINYQAAKFDPTTQAKIQFRGIIEDELLASGEKAAKEAGSEFAAGYVHAKQQYRAAAWVKDATSKGASAEARNRTNGMSELAGQLGGGNAGGAAGAAIGSLAGPIGSTVLGAVGHVTGALAGAAMQNLTRRYGDQIAATVISRAMKTDIVRAVSQTVDEHLGDGVAKFLGQARGRVQQTSIVNPMIAEMARTMRRSQDEEKRDYAEKRAQLSSFLAAPQQRLAATTAPLQGASPTLVQRVQQQAMTGAQFLQSKVPPAAPGSLTPQFDKDRTSASDKSKWLRYVRAVDDPMSVLHDMSDGKITREGVEALKTVYPLIYGQVQEEVQRSLAGLTKPLDYAKKAQLASLLGVAPDPSFTPAFGAAVQAALASSTPGGAPPGAAPPKGAPSVHPVKFSSVSSTQPRTDALLAQGKK